MSVLVCLACGNTCSLQTPRWRCECGGMLDVSFRASFPLEMIAQRPASMWRYREALPLDHPESAVTLGEGWTPLTSIETPDGQLRLKHDYLFPTGSFKDRGASMLVSRLAEIGMDAFLEDSSGNAGAALAAYAGAAGIDCRIYLPMSAPEGKKTQIGLYGAELFPIEGDRSSVAGAALEAALSGIYYGSHVWDPFFMQGTKTAAYEICEQCGWRAPGTIVAPVGNGSLLLGLVRGLDDLEKAGVIGKTVRIIAVQSEKCSPVFDAFRGNKAGLASPSGKPILADGIAVPAPPRLQQIVGAIRAWNGDVLTVTDAEVGEAVRMLGSRGICVEPTGAVACAGALRYLREHDGECADGPVVAVLTGHGLKNVEKMGILTGD